MQISYNKLFKLLIDKGMKKTDLAKEAKLTRLHLQSYLNMKMYLWIR